jgi:putative peptidoglycan lipid II flippase
MTSRVLGLVREQVVAYLFGASHAVDAFNVAFRMPNLLRDLFAEGAMSAAFVPTFTRYLARGTRDDAWELGCRVLTALALTTAAVAALGMIFAAPLVRLFAADYASVPGKLELTVTLTRVMFPFLMLVAVAAAVMGMLNALNRFFLPALSPAMFNVATIACALLLAPVLPAWAGRRWRRWRLARSSAEWGRLRFSGPRSGAKDSAFIRAWSFATKACATSWR